MPISRQIPGILFIILPLLCIPLGLSAKGPDWLTGKAGNGLYRYYVGVSTSQDEASAMQEAYGNAVEQAMRENFGSAVEIGVQTFENTRESTYTRRVTEKSQRALIRGFEQVDTHRKGGTLYVLFRYSTDEIAKERARLEQNIPLDDRLYSEATGSFPQRGGIDLTTEPEDVQVFIDDVPWGKTNLKLLNKLEPGLHTVRLEHPYFLTVFEEVIIVPNDVVKVAKTMVRAEGTLSITTRPVIGAEVFINDKNVGKTPIDCNVPAGIVSEIRIEHPETEPVTTRATVSKKEIRSIDQNLVLKPSALTIASIPESAMVRVNGIGMGMTPVINMPVPARQRLTIQLTREDCMEHTFTLSGLAGGENKTIPPISLQQITPGTKFNTGERTIEPVSSILPSFATKVDRSWAINAGMRYLSDPFEDFDANLGGFYLNVERKLIGMLWIQAGGSYFAKSTKDTIGEERLYGQEISIALPVRIGSAFKIVPEAGRFYGEASTVIDRSNELKEDIETTFYGVQAGIATLPGRSPYLSLLLNARKYSDHESFVGKTSYGFNVGVGFLF
ncbi:MAG TPA: PEGA domain-containing protein [Syntrophorhabdus sp.]|nr:PEGA domain-containing protein [Syntrophorhabdus sp.]